MIETDVTDEEEAALRLYSGPSHGTINGHLRGEDEVSGIGPVIIALDSAIAKSFLREDVTLYRGLNGDAAAYLRRSGLDVGDTFWESGFASTSADPGRAQLFRSWLPDGLILRIHVKAGMLALDMRDFSDQPEEREFLLPRNAIFRVTGIGESGIVDVELA